MNEMVDNGSSQLQYNKNYFGRAKHSQASKISATESSQFKSQFNRMGQTFGGTSGFCNDRDESDISQSNNQLAESHMRKFNEQYQ